MCIPPRTVCSISVSCSLNEDGKSFTRNMNTSERTKRTQAIHLFIHSHERHSTLSPCEHNKVSTDALFHVRQYSTMRAAIVMTQEFVYLHIPATMPRQLFL